MTIKLHLPSPSFPSFQALKVPFSYTQTQSSFVSHTHIYKLCSPLLGQIDSKCILTNYDVISRKLEHVSIHSSVRKRTKMGQNKSMETTQRWTANPVLTPALAAVTSPLLDKFMASANNS